MPARIFGGIVSCTLPTACQLDPTLTYAVMSPSSRIKSRPGTEPAKDVDAPAMNLTGSPACARVMNSI